MSIENKLTLSEKEKLLPYYLEEWKMFNQYLNDIDRGYITFITIFITIVTFTITIISLIADCENTDLYTIFYVIPLAFIVTFGCMGYQFRTTAILRGHLANIENEMNYILGENIYMWNSSLTETYMAHQNLPNKGLMVPIFVFVILIALLCFLQTISFGALWINIVYWTVVIFLSLWVLIPFFRNDKIRWQTYKNDEVIKKYKEYLIKNKEKWNKK